MGNDSYLSQEELEALEAEMDEAEPDTGELISDTIRKKAAALTTSGASKLKIRKELGLSGYAVNKLFQDEGFRKLVADIGDDAVAATKARTRAMLARMQDKAMKALEDNLNKKNLEAVKVWLRSIGLDQQQPGDDKGGGFTLVLAAGQKPEPKTVTVKREEEE